MPLYQLHRQSLKGSIPPGRYLLDAGRGLPRLTIQIDGEIEAEDLAEAIREKYGSGNRAEEGLE